MKKIILIVLVIAAFTPSFAQKGVTVSLCGNNDNVTEKEKIIEKTVKIAKLLDCPEMTATHNWNVSSFVFSILIKGSGKDDTVMELTGAGNKLTERMLVLIKKYNPKKIYLEKLSLTKGDEKFNITKPLVLLVNY